MLIKYKFNLKVCADISKFEINQGKKCNKGNIRINTGLKVNASSSQNKGTLLQKNVAHLTHSVNINDLNQI